MPSVVHMTTTAVGAALADVPALVHAAQVATVRAGGVTWTGAAADAADDRRTALLASLRTCLDALDAADRVLADVRRAEQRCVAPGPALVARW